VLADKAYSHPSTRAALRQRKIPFTSPERRDQIQHRRSKGARGARPPAFDQAIYAGRNVVERCFNRLKQFRALATRYAKRAAYYRTEIIIAAIVLWLRTDLQDGLARAAQAGPPSDAASLQRTPPALGFACLLGRAIWKT
jgi:transposase